MEQQLYIHAKKVFSAKNVEARWLVGDERESGRNMAGRSVLHRKRTAFFSPAPRL